MVPVEGPISKGFGSRVCVNSLTFLAPKVMEYQERPSRPGTTHHVSATVAPGSGRWGAAQPASSWIVTEVIATGSFGRSLWSRGAETMRSTMSSPRVTCPNSV